MCNGRVNVCFLIPVYLRRDDLWALLSASPYFSFEKVAVVAGSGGTDLFTM